MKHSGNKPDALVNRWTGLSQKTAGGGKPKKPVPTRSVCGLFSALLFSFRLVFKKSQSKVIGEAVLRYRKKAGFSQEALAEKADIHPNYVGRIERGECSASVTIFLKIAKALNVRPYKLFLKL